MVAQLLLVDPRPLNGAFLLLRRSSQQLAGNTCLFEEGGRLNPSRLGQNLRANLIDCDHPRLRFDVGSVGITDQHCLQLFEVAGVMADHHQLTREEPQNRTGREKIPIKEMKDFTMSGSKAPPAPWSRS